jgi:hypothetical protein
MEHYEIWTTVSHLPEKSLHCFRGYRCERNSFYRRRRSHPYALEEKRAGGTSKDAYAYCFPQGEGIGT